MTSPRSFWDHQVLQAASAAHRLWVGGKPILFDAGSQQIFQQNDSSAAIWTAVCSEGTPAAAARSLSADEKIYPLILTHVRDAVAEWLRLGLVRPAALSAASDAPRQVGLQWMGCCVGLNISGAVDLEALLGVFAPFISTEAPSHVLDIREMGGLIFISDDQGQTCARSQAEWIPEVKARFTARILATVRPGFLVHAALLSRNGQGILVCGAPGAGKTTLSVSLLLAGFGYHADDIVWIGEAGDAVGAPFAPALKEGTWPLLEEMGGDLPTSPTYLRADSQQVRYLLPPAVRQAPVGIGSIVLLERQAGGAGRVEAVEPLEILTAILGSAYSARGAISPPALRSLIDCIQRARTGRLCFSEWPDGRRLVDEFAP